MIARTTIPGAVLATLISAPCFAQHATRPAEKVAIRVPQPPRIEREPHVPPANAEIDGNGKIIPLPATRANQDGNLVGGELCTFKASDIRRQVERAAREEGLSTSLAWAVASFEREERIRHSGDNAAARIWPTQIKRPACDPVTAIRSGVGRLARLNLAYSEMLHTLAAYRDGEDRLAEDGGIPSSIETLRFIATVMNDAVGGPTLRPIARETARGNEARPVKSGQSSTPPSIPSSHQPGEPRWASGFVLNLE